MRAPGAMSEARLRCQYDAVASAGAARVDDGAGFASVAWAPAWMAGKRVSRGESRHGVGVER